MLNLGYEGTSGVSASPNEAALFSDLNDLGRIKQKDSSGNLSVPGYFKWPKNHLINGGWDFAQRQVPGTLTSKTPGVASRAYAADAWFVCNEANDIQFQQIDTAGAFETGMVHRYYGKFKKITAVGKVLFGQILAAENTAVLRGKRVRVHFKLKRTIAAAMNVRLGLAQLTAAGTIDVIPGYVAGAPSGTFVSAWGGAGVDPTLGTNVTRIIPVPQTSDGGTIAGEGMNGVVTGAWTRFSCCFDVPTTVKNLIAMVWTDGQLAINDELNVTECIMTEGFEIVEWIPFPQEFELERCKRLYAKSFAIAVAPATNAGQANSVQAIAGKAGAVALAGNIHIRFPVIMRATPTVNLFCPTEASNQVDRLTGTTPIAHTATAQADLGDQGLTATSTGTTNTAVGDIIGVHYTADASL